LLSFESQNRNASRDSSQNDRPSCSGDLQRLDSLWSNSQDDLKPADDSQPRSTPRLPPSLVPHVPTSSGHRVSPRRHSVGGLRYVVSSGRLQGNPRVMLLSYSIPTSSCIRPVRLCTGTFRRHRFSIVGANMALTQRLPHIPDVEKLSPRVIRVLGGNPGKVGL